MPRFVILTHDFPFFHWDLMLERSGVLRTWRLLSSPELSEAVPAEALADHRLEYLDYEGPISGGRGQVRRWDSGRYTLLSAGKSWFEAHLVGRRLKGTAVIALDKDGDRWTFHFQTDRTTGKSHAQPTIS